MNKEQISELEKKISLIMKFGTLLHNYGAPAHRLERVMCNISKSLDLRGQFFCTPTTIMASFDTPIGRRPALLRTQPGSVELEKTILVDKIGDQLIAREISITDACTQLDEISQMPNPYSPLVSVISFATVSAVVSTLFGGGLVELLFAFLIGMIVGRLRCNTMKMRKVKRIYESLVAFFAVLLASTAFHFYPYFSTQIVVLSSLMVLIPGLAITIAVQELATDNLVSGTARMMHAAITFFKIAFGIVFANKVVENIFPEISNYIILNPLPNYASWIALLFAPFAFTVLFKARPKEAPWIFLASVVGILASRLGAHYFGSELGAFSGGLAVGVFSNFYTKFKNKPAAVTMLPGIILLVPGSIGFRGISSMLEQNVVMGMDLGFTMLILAMALSGGLFLANILVSANRSL